MKYHGVIVCEDNYFELLGEFAEEFLESWAFEDFSSSSEDEVGVEHGSCEVEDECFGYFVAEGERWDIGEEFVDRWFGEELWGVEW